MVDPQELDGLGVVVNLVEDPVRTAAGAEGAREFPLERLTDPPRIRGEVSVHELDDRGNNTRRDTRQIPSRCRGEDDLMAQRPRVGTPNSSRICSSL